jgi:uncharacterized cupredoxin-like copper-binding protein
MPTRRHIMIAAAAIPIASTAALAGPGHEKAHGPVKKEQKSWGIAGDAKSVNRSIAVSMSDTMRFTPDRINVKQGETIKFIAKNQGKVVHEFVLGSKEELEEHAALMVKFPAMEHSEPYMMHVSPGKTGQIIWKFNQPGNFDFACLIPGHYQAGMVGKITVASI